MSPRFDGRTVLVTGGTRGVGRTTVLGLARAGATVIAVYRSDSVSAAALTDQPDWDPSRCSLVQADVSTAEGRATVVAQLDGGLDILVNNHATYDPAPLAALDATAIAESLQTNLIAHIQLTQAVLPLLRDGGAIVNLGAGMADRGRPAHTLFTAAKAGLVGFTRSLHLELADRRIRVNTVAPGVVETERGIDLPPPVRAQILSSIPLLRFVTATDVANTVLFLASDLAGAMSGATVKVDGGI
jgi:3-oxoacyl-[acyl-carrier protein] reductase